MAAMTVFVSSLITGMEPLRAAARAGVEALGHRPVMAEDFAARPDSPQVACLEGVRGADAVVLILGARYGAKQASGLSATHEEYREAKGARPVIAFVEEQGADREPEQAAFLREVQGWEGGLFRGGFAGPQDLQSKVTRALHEWRLANASGPLDPGEVLGRAVALLPARDRNHHYNEAVVALSLAGGPAQPVLRPSEMEAPALAEDAMQAALFGPARIFDRAEGTGSGIRDGVLFLEQGGRHRRSVALDAQGGIVVSLPLPRGERRGHWMPVLLEEKVRDAAAGALRYGGWLLDRVDPTRRLSHVAIAARIAGGDGLAWRTEREHAANPSSVELPNAGRSDHPPVHLAPAHRPRAALSFGAEQLVEDLVVLLRRQWRG